ncbi:MAG: aldose epimerase family protein [Planctomycetota bacterium]|jgi:aldose 1-epimerase
MNTEKSDFGQTKDGTSVELFTLANDHGMSAKITNYGGVIIELWVPDRDGNPSDVVLGFDNITDYEEKNFYLGCITGRYANRIADGKFELDGVTYDKLATNNGPNHLHGGLKGFDKQVWDAETFQTADTVGLRLHYLSKDSEEGYPGNLNVTVTYMLTNDNELKIEYEATTDKPTICNLTNHSYFNLAGHAAGTAANLAHKMMINADGFTPVADEGAIPTGEIRPVRGTPMDFTTPTPISAHIDDDDDQLKFGAGFDHNFVLDKSKSVIPNPVRGEEPVNKSPRSGSLFLAARVTEPTTGRIMEVFTTEPGVQLYSGNYLDGLAGKGGAVYPRRSAFCLETQHYPDSPNKPEFPSTVLRPSEQFESTTIFKFSKK